MQSKFFDSHRNHNSTAFLESIEIAWLCVPENKKPVGGAGKPLRNFCNPLRCPDHINPAMPTQAYDSIKRFRQGIRLRNQPDFFDAEYDALTPVYLVSENFKVRTRIALGNKPSGKTVAAIYRVFEKKIIQPTFGVNRIRTP